MPVIRERIATTSQKLPWAEAFERMKPDGGIASHVLLGRHLYDDGYRGLLPPQQRYAIDTLFPLCSGELYAHPAKGERFDKRKDLEDSLAHYVIPLSEITKLVPRSEVRTRKAGLFIKVNRVISETLAGHAISVIYPEEIIIVYPALEESGMWGQVDKKTGMVLEVPDSLFTKKLPYLTLKNYPNLWGEVARDTDAVQQISDSLFTELPNREKRRLHRSDEAGFGPPLYSRGSVRVSYLQDGNPLSVASVARDIINFRNRVLVEDVSLADFQALAQGETPERLKFLRPEQLEAARKLAEQFIQVV